MITKKQKIDFITNQLVESMMHKSRKRTKRLLDILVKQ